MLTAIILGPSYEEAISQIDFANVHADVLEFRLDLFQFTDTKGTELADTYTVRSLLQKASRPVIFTLRPKRGEDEALRCERLLNFAKLKPTYFDIESHISTKLFEEITPYTQCIVSYHNFSETPLDLPKLFKSIQNPHATLYKIVTFANSTMDGLRMLQFVRTRKNVIGFCMGESGQFTRILSTIYGSQMTYATINATHSFLPCQLDIKTLLNLYHYKQLSPKTKVFCLIGDPISQSPSHRAHNHIFRSANVDGVYVKLRVKKKEIEQFLHFAKELKFFGVSVTSPLKEKVAQFLNSNQETAAVNTLLFKDGEIQTTNTDGKGALDAIEQHLNVQNKLLVILGAGGAAKAIACEANKRGAKITILNRTVEKSHYLAERFGGTAAPLKAFASIAKKGYDVIINATASETTFNREILDNLAPNTLAMDINYGETAFLIAAKKKWCQIIKGEEMFIRQAVYQFAFWLKSKGEVEKMLRESLKDV